MAVFMCVCQAKN
uniref:Uncharacterized protein n=1 Tax=Anguilla anguilla TaxID=7936 RepID=A0A0E9TQ51_ANGAN